MAPNKDSIEIKTIDEIHSEDFKLRPPFLTSLSHLVAVLSLVGWWLVALTRRLAGLADEIRLDLSFVCLRCSYWRCSPSVARERRSGAKNVSRGCFSMQNFSWLKFTEKREILSSVIYCIFDKNGHGHILFIILSHKFFCFHFS